MCGGCSRGFGGVQARFRRNRQEFSRLERQGAGAGWALSQAGNAIVRIASLGKARGAL